VDAPYLMPAPESLNEPPQMLSSKRKPIKANHYGRNIENIIDLISEKEDGEQKTAMIRSLAIYMRQQYLIWNKDTVADETIFQDIEKLSDYRIKVPEGLTLGRPEHGGSFQRPNNSGKQNKGQNRQRNNQKNFRKK
jgi:hypothetical protein